MADPNEFTLATAACRLLYLVLLFAIAHGGNGLVPRRVVRHPLVYILGLGVYAGIWAVYAAVGLAAETGPGFSPITLGIVALSCWHRCCSTHHAHRAGLPMTSWQTFAFRYRSQWAGTGHPVFRCGHPVATTCNTGSFPLPPCCTGHLPQCHQHVFALTVILFAVLFGPA